MFRRFTQFARLRSRSAGQRGERLAARFLRKHGLRILGRNLRNRFGEVDLLALDRHSRTLIIVEVKTSATQLARPELRVDRRKQARLTALAAQIARQHRLTDHRIRFDVVAVLLAPHGRAHIRHYPAAFEATV